MIQKEDGTFSETVTIPESLSVSISGLAAGTYTITEVKAGEGYQLNKKIETVVLDANNYQIHIPFYNDVIEKKITIYKTYGTSKQLWPEENAVFEIYHSEELIATIQTDENGYGSINLPYGTYRIKQIQDVYKRQVLVGFNFLLILMYTSYCHYTITLRNFVPSNDIYNKRDKNGTI